MDKWVMFYCTRVVEYVMDVVKFEYKDKALDAKNDSRRM